MATGTSTLRYATNYNGPNATNSGRYQGGANITVGPSGFKSGTVGFANAVYATTGSAAATQLAMGGVPAYHATTAVPASQGAAPPITPPVTEIHASVNTPVNSFVDTASNFIQLHPIATLATAAGLGAAIGGLAGFATGKASSSSSSSSSGGKRMGIFGSSSGKKHHKKSAMWFAKEYARLKLKKKYEKEKMRF